MDEKYIEEIADKTRKLLTAKYGEKVFEMTDTLMEQLKKGRV